MRVAALVGALLGCGLLVCGLLGCGPNPADTGGAGGAEVCVWCADEPPRVRPCTTTMIASGGQRVCVDNGDSRLCEAPTCGEEFRPLRGIDAADPPQSQLEVSP